MSDQPETNEKVSNEDAPQTTEAQGECEDDKMIAKTATGGGAQSRSDIKSNASAGLEDNNVQPNNVLANNIDKKNSLGDSNLKDGQKEPDTQSERKVSAVSFKEKCDFYEVDLCKTIKRSANGPSDHTIKPPFTRSLRYFIILLSLISPFIVTYSRTIINFAVTDMILNKNDNSDNSSSTIESESKYYFDFDNSCPVDQETRHRLKEDIQKDESKRQINGEKFDWDSQQQGVLKGAYPFGHALLQVVGGRYSELYGSHWIMSISALLIGICCLVAPFLASIHYLFMVIDLALLGILGSFMSPSLITLFSNWLTPSEKSVALSFYLVASRLGYALSSLLFAFLIEAQLSWRYLFYTAGWISLLFAVTFVICVRSRPQDHPFIGEAELDYLKLKNRLVREALEREQHRVKDVVEMKYTAGKVDEDPRPKHKADSKGAPWLEILTNQAVWAFIITKFCVKLAGDTVQTELPTYLKRVLHVSAKYNGFINTSNYVIFCISCLIVASITKMAKKYSFGLSKTNLRKLFQCTASFSVAIILFAVSMNVCNNQTTVVLIMMFFFMTTLSTGGEAQIPFDISERYSGTIHAIGSSLAISGFLEPVIVGIWLEKGSANQEKWAAVWWAASAIACFGGLVFLIFGDATVQSFDNVKQKDADTKEEYVTIKLSEGIKTAKLKGEESKTSEVKENNTLSAPSHCESA